MYLCVFECCALCVHVNARLNQSVAILRVVRWSVTGTSLKVWVCICV